MVVLDASAAVELLLGTPRGAGIAAALPLVTHDPAALITRTWSLRQNATPYDTCYLALAEGLGAPLLTGDGRLARSSDHRADVVVV